MASDLGAVLARLDEFRAAQGHLYVPTHYVCADGFRLGRWVASRRHEKRHGRLHFRYSVLETLPGWDWRAHNRRLVEGLDRLGAYVEQYGTSRVPLEFVCDDGFRLGVWVVNRRTDGHRHPWLTEILEQMPDWHVRRWPLESEQQRRADRAADEELLRRVELFLAEHGTTKVPRGYVCDDDFKLGAILLNRRRRSERRPDRHQELLQAIAALPDERPRVPPNERLRMLSIERGLMHLWDYLQAHDTACVPNAYVTPDRFNLGGWVRTRRSYRGRDHAVDALLESLPGWTWAPLERAFAEQLRRFERAADANRLTGNRKLLNWAGKQRRAAQAGKLSQSRLSQLRDAGVLAVHMHPNPGRNVCTRGSEEH
jgi:hypothetical protein